MFGLTFLSFGGTLPFWARAHRPSPLVFFSSLSLGSVRLRARSLVLVVPSKTMPLLISIFMLAVAAVSLSVMRAVIPEASPIAGSGTLGLSRNLLLGIYGGFFSGGYVTMLTAVFVVCLGMTYVQAVANTKPVDVFSSLVATLIFMWRGIVDYRLGLILAVVMFIGAIIGARVALKLDNLWLRRVFFWQRLLLWRLKP